MSPYLFFVVQNLSEAVFVGEIAGFIWKTVFEIFKPILIKCPTIDEFLVFEGARGHVSLLEDTERL